LSVKPTIRKGGGFSFAFNLVVNNILVSLPMNKHNKIIRYEINFM